MSDSKLKELIIRRLGRDLYYKAKDFPNNNINIITKQNDPLFIRVIFFDNERDFHLIVDEERKEIFHDCPSFLIYSSVDKKICIHFLKLLLLLNESKALDIFKEIDNYEFTSEDFGSQRKSTNFQILANVCFKNDNDIDGLNYLSKAIIDQSQCASIIQKYLKNSMEKNLFIEFFEFLQEGYQNQWGTYFKKYNHLIKQAFQKLINSLDKYSFYNLLRIINSLDGIINKKDFSFLLQHIDKFEEMIHSSDLNKKYFAIYFIKKNYNTLIEISTQFKNIIPKNQLNYLKKLILNYFIEEIENFIVIDKLILMENQFKVLGISENQYKDKFEDYKQEINELEKKVYLKKFAFLKLLMHKYNVKITKVDFRKKRNVYVVNHEPENLKNPTYIYIIKKIGFYGINNSTIKSSDLGINYFIVKELFLDDFSKFPDIFYYKTQFWGDQDYQIKARDGISLLSKSKEYSYNIDKHYTNERVMIIEWDLAKKPIKGSIINAYSSQIIIPDQNSPLFHDLKPFDLCYCIKSPVKIEANIIKTVNVITKSSFKDAIKSVSNGMEFIEGYYPLSLIKSVINKEINPFKANKLVTNNPNRRFIPHYTKFIKEFRKFLFKFIEEEKDYIFDKLKQNVKDRVDQILILLNLSNKLNGMNLPYSQIIEKTIEQNLTITSFKDALIKEIHKYIQNILRESEIGATKIFNLKKMKNTPFIKYSDKILRIRKLEFQNTPIFKSNNYYDLSEIKETYYGAKIANLMGLGKKQTLSLKGYNKFNELAKRLNLEIKLIQK
ncbi:MAG: hypothetical protein EU547_00365 [Promethearchaeota archaeon]|nr:MAG: hypothetical protein EU547_00365 [Candidatus Lokiarchaeota archaeon]